MPMDPGVSADHAWPKFKWEKKPSCSCGKLIDAVEEGWLFVSNFTDDTSNTFYLMPVGADGHFARSSGIPIQHCPWCGDKITGRKKYPQ